MPAVAAGRSRGGHSGAAARADYTRGVVSTPGKQSYRRLGEASGSVAADAGGAAAGTYVGGFGLGARGVPGSGADSAVRFDGVHDELRASHVDRHSAFIGESPA